MKVAVIGGGSVGLLFASRLHFHGHDVQVITRNRVQAEQIRQQGITLREQSGVTRVAYVSAVPVSEEWQSAEICLLAVKQPDLPGLFPMRQKLSAFPRVIALQNGMGHRQLLEEMLLAEQLFYAVNTHGARRTSPVQVEHTGQGMILIGHTNARYQSDQLIASFVSAASSSGLDAVQVADIELVMWRKLLANAVINPLTALFEINNGALLDEPRLLAMMRELFEEAMLVANVTEPKINETVWQEILAICRNTSRNYSSMLQDIWNHKPTEIEAINGYIVTKGREYGIPTPLHETLHRAVQLKSHLRRSRSEQQ